MRIVVDEPSPDAVVGETVLVRGWAYGSGTSVSRVEVEIDGQVRRAAIARPRRDVAAALADPAAALAGYEVEVPVPALPSTSISITVTALAMDGAPSASRTVTVTQVRSPGRAIPMSTRRRPRRRRRRGRQIRLLVAARSLDLGGSQLRMAELLEVLAQDPRFAVTVSSPTEGPLRDRLEAAGVQVCCRPDVDYGDPTAYTAGIADLSAWIDGRFDLVLGFTITSFATLDAAANAGVPGILRVGESEPLGTVARWVGMPLHPEVEVRARAVIGDADFVGFPSAATRDSHLADGLRGRFGTLPPSTDTEGPRRAIAEISRADARAVLSVPAHARLLLFPASLWPIKGQGVLLHALAAVASRHPDLLVVLVGDGTPEYRDVIVRLKRVLRLDDHLWIRPFTDDLRQWWRAADALVCSSESEAAPGIALEAGAYGLPLVSTRVGFIPELVEPVEGGWLCEPSDVAAMARVLEEAALAPSNELTERGQRLQERVYSSYGRSEVAALTRDLLIAVAAGRSPSGIRVYR